MSCDPCQFCAHYIVEYDRNIGWSYDCAVNAEDLKPCPGFTPRLASDGLYEQLFNEEEAEYYKREAE